jgi:hypothetical protein
MDGGPGLVTAAPATAEDEVPTRRDRRVRSPLVAPLVALLVALALAGCASEEVRTAEELVLEGYPAASGAEEEEVAQQALGALAEVEPAPGWQVWRTGLSDEVRRGAADILVDHLDAVMEAAGAEPGPPHPAWIEVTPEEVARVLRHVLEDELAGERVARATGARMEAELAPRVAEPDREVQRAAAGWMAATSAVLDELGTDVERRWFRAATLGSLEAAERRARDEGGDAPWGMLAAAYGAYLDGFEERWSELTWITALDVFVVPLRWMQQDPAAVQELALTDVPEWDLEEDVVERWREGEDVAEDPEVLELALAWGEWLDTVEARGVSELRGEVGRATRPLRDPEGWRQDAG